MRIWIGLILFLVLQLVSLSQGAEKETPKVRKEINFEGELVEGAARQSLDSLTQTDSSRKSKARLYDRTEKLQDRNLERVTEIIETY